MITVIFGIAIFFLGVFFGAIGLVVFEIYYEEDQDDDR